MIVKTLQVRRAQKLAKLFETALHKNKDRILSLTHEKQQHPFAVVFASLKQKTLEILNKNRFFSEDKESVFLTRGDIELLESHVLTTISYETKQLEKNLFILPTIVTLGPFLGLLGTVWGILLTFSEWKTGTGTTSNAAVLGGLATALVTTVLGLVIAIPAVISHNWLKNSFKYLSSDMEDFLYKLLSTIELQYRKPH